MKFSLRTVFVALILWIFVVGGFFILIPEKRIAGVIAGIGFILIPSLLLAIEFHSGNKSKWIVISSLIFLICSALPIFCLRVFNWDMNFQELSLFGLSSEFLHKSSNVLYALMVIAVGFEAFCKNKKKTELKNSYK